MDYKKLYDGKDKRYYAHDRTELLPFIPKNIRYVLDIGCGNGAFGMLLKKTFPGLEVWGVEPDEISAGEAAGRLDRVINGLFSNTDPGFAGKKFDAIFFNDVLEHLADPAEAIASCRALLATDGHVVASIPNIRWYPVVLSLLRYQDFKYANAGVMDKTHLRFFTRKSMIRLFEDCGCKVESITGINKSTDFKFFNVLNFLTLGKQEDMKYPQFVTVATFV